MKLNLVRNSLSSATALLLAFGAGQAVGADYQSTVLSFNPVAYWRLNETTAVPAANIAANAGSLGTVGNGYVVLDVTNAEPGIVGNSFRFSNPTGDAAFCGSKVDVPYNPTLNPNGPFTVEFWAKPTGVTPSDVNGLIAVSAMNPDFSIDANNRSGWLFYQVTDGHWQFRVGGEHSSYVATPKGGAVTANAWHHIVGVYDGATATLYVNGQKVAGPANAPLFNPNTTRTLRIGGSLFNGGLDDSNTDGNRGFDGWLDELAVYTTALSADVIAAHYDAATTNNAGYGAQILASNPVGYWHLDESVYDAPDPSTFPVASNSGTGTGADGTYQPGSTTGNAGPVASALGANTASQLSGVVGNIAIGNPDALNFVGPITLIAWVKPAQVDGSPTLREIVAHGYDANGAEVSLLLDQGMYEVGSTVDGTTFNIVADPMPSGDAGNWVFLAGTYDGTTWSLYRYDKLIASGDFDTGAIMMDAPWSIGSRGDTSADGRFFGGGVDEVAIFDKALTADQLKQVFYSANVLPIISEAPQPPSGPVYEGSTLTFNVAAEGNPPLTYQWTKGGNSLTGQTTTQLTLGNVTANDSGTYAVVVTNPIGSTTNSFLVTVVPSAPVVLQQPQPATRFVGASVTFSVKAVGSSPVTYQWTKDTVDIPGATSTSYTRSALQSADAGNYACKLLNPLGSTNTEDAALTILPLPGGYATAIGADNPIAYWRLGETDGTTAHDYWGGKDGQFNNVALGQLGFSVTDSDTAVGFGPGPNSFVGSISGTQIDFAGTSSAFTLEAWANGSDSQASGAAIICKGTGGGGEQFSIDVFNGQYRFYVWPASGNAAVAQADIGPNGTWQHVLATYDQTGGAMKIYINGVESGGGGAPPAIGPRATTHPVSIGSRRGSVDPGYDLNFVGALDEVAIYDKALTPDQALAHYNARYGTTTAPIIDKNPASATNYVSRTVTLRVVAGGSPTLSYQWKKGTVNIPGANSETLALGPLALSDAGDYSVVVSNQIGTKTSNPATVSVLPIPASAIATPGLVLHLPFDSNYSDTSGRTNNGTAVGAPTFVDGKIGPNSLHYSTTTSDGMSGSAVTAANYVTLGVRPDLQFGSNVNFSVAYWVRFSEPNSMPGDLPFIANNNGSYGDPGYTFASSYKEGGWSWYINNKTGGAFGGIGLYSPDMNNINDGTWHHLAHTFDRTGNAITYLDGLQVNSTPISAGASWDLGTGKPTNIGQASGTYPEPGEFDIDDIGMWSKVLSPIEVDGIYLGGNVNGVSFTNATTNVSITIENLGAQIRLTWPSGTLESADALTGQFSTVMDQGAPVTSPYKATPLGTKFYRVKL
jgi:hypothetical protein